MRENTELREELADLAHKQWSGWMEYLFSKGNKNEDGTFTIPAWAVERWERQLNTEYKDLSESEKDSDRNEADKFIDAFENYLARSEEELENEDSGILLGRDTIYEALMKHII